MKKLLLSLLILGGLNAHAQVAIFDDSFEFYDDFAIENIGDWTTLDIDLLPTYGFTGVTFANSGIAKSFQVFNATTTAPALTPSATADWTAKTGDRHMVCFASVPSTTGGATANNDWLISPQITLGTTNTVKFWAKACDATYFAERFSVWVSTTGVAPTDFVKISTGAYLTTPNITWAEYTYNLAASYNGLPVYIGIKCTSPDMFGFAIDDFSVSAVALATENFVTSNFAVYPNPASSVVNINAKNNSIVINTIQLTDINGRIVKQVKGMTNQINISELNAGVYFLKISTDQGTGITKIIKN
ncbi:T9SS-dependent choice-of-anchor J family protein [Flavobacterium sp.]|uniref:T9SS-dependent choice-of-anchor J family protein n=1 Tax=Flavobacterium sp. TaxID=239 RepID=UPI00286C8FE2|nr:choice-of-anchor J domain-containing protein [Flavobacterium sp.]